jgi:hypothetical protein
VDEWIMEKNVFIPLIVCVFWRW